MSTLPMIMNGSSSPSLFSDFFSDFERAIPTLLSNGGGSSGVLSFDVAETPESYIITANVPGMKKEWIDVTVQRERLTLSVKPEEERSGTENMRYIYRERRMAPVSRSVTLPHASPEGVEAHLMDGVLTVTIRKDESKLPRRIAIN